MAAYGALVCLTHILDQILHPPPGQHQFIIEHMESLRERVLSLLDFLENHSRKKEIRDLETRIADAAYAAEDIIESAVVNQILAGGKSSSFTKIFRSRENSVVIKTKKDIPMIIEEFLSIEKDLVNIKGVEYQQQFEPPSTTVEPSNPLPRGKDTMVGFNDHLNIIMSALTTDNSSVQIIPIVGMGGIGKTTLALNVYNNAYIMEKFQIRAWCAVSQQFNGKDILLGLLRQIMNIDKDGLNMNANQLGEKLYKELFLRKYLIVMDDMWDIKAWEFVKRFLPNNNNGSRILVTTRQLKLAIDFGSDSPYKLSFLDEAQSWDLLRAKIFAEKCCPVELEVIGKRIAKKCRGLPLALVVVGGLLAKSKREYWKYVEEDVTSVVNNEDNEFCMKILSLSYNHLPVYLKPCFLYLAVFPEDFDIQGSTLIRLWVAEGFIKQHRGKSLETIGEEYLKDLIDRNLILVGKRGITGKVKTCRIHDILRDLCTREAEKDNFLGIAKLDNPKIPQCSKDVRRLSVHGGTWKDTIFKTSGSTLPTRSFLTYYSGNSRNFSCRRFKLLRVLDVVARYRADEILQLINSRYIACIGQKYLKLASIHRLWSLQTLIVDTDLTLPSEIWKMPHLRHLKARRISLPDPPRDAQMDGRRIIVLEKLQTLSTVEYFRCTEEVIERIPNVKKLGISCHATKEVTSHLGLLHKLESLAFTGAWGNMVIPSSLKKLALSKCKIPWEDMSIVGSLPNLEVLKLQKDATVGQNWIPNEGEFVRLKFLLIHQCALEIWEGDNTHFPCLEQLHLGHVSLKEIPAEFAEILSLQVIDLNHCSDSLLESAKKISEQREDLGYEVLQIRNYTMGLLRIHMERGINLAVHGGRSRDPYIVAMMGKQRLKTRVIRKNINPEWNEDLTFAVQDPSLPVSLAVYDSNTVSIDENMGDAEFDIRPFIEAVQMNQDGSQDGTVIKRVLPARSNCLSEESPIVWRDNRVEQHMLLRLRNVVCGEIQLQLQWINIPMIF